MMALKTHTDISQNRAQWATHRYDIILRVHNIVKTKFTLSVNKVSQRLRTYVLIKVPEKSIHFRPIFPW